MQVIVWLALEYDLRAVDAGEEWHRVTTKILLRISGESACIAVEVRVVCTACQPISEGGAGRVYCRSGRIGLTELGRRETCQ
jgi:hypothetical protein